MSEASTSGRGAGGAATIADVAEAAGVSIRTVSRVLNASPRVNAETKASILAAIERLGFRPNARARGLAAGRSFLIGVVQDDPNAHVIGVLQRGIAETCAARGYELVVHPARFHDPGLADNIIDFVRRSYVDGLILLPPISERRVLAEALAALRLPVVAMAAVREPGHPAMLVSGERDAAAMVARHLLELGHRRVAMIAGPSCFYSTAEREAGFRAALEAAGLTLPPAYRREGNYGFASGLEQAAALLALPEPPTAIFAANDIMAAAVLKAAAERRFAVPEQLSVVGFDDSDIASMVTPALTTVRRPLSRMAVEATRRLLDMIDGQVCDLDLAVELSLVVRGSTAPPRVREG